jgi:hypothetical protein
MVALTPMRETEIPETAFSSTLTWLIAREDFSRTVYVMIDIRNGWDYSKRVSKHYYTFYRLCFYLQL